MPRLLSAPALALSCCLFCAICTGAQAAPAPWYKWRSKLGAGLICAQTSPGKGWVKLRTPYKDAGCRIPEAPGRRAAPLAGTTHPAP